MPMKLKNYKKARVNFSQSETSSLLRGWGGGGRELNFELLLWRGGRELTEKILKFPLKKLKHHCQKIQKWSFRGEGGEGGVKSVGGGGELTEKIQILIIQRSSVHKRLVVGTTNLG